ncbi:MAG TPA: amino acid adenylation domain-containing protein, partial [Thermoanaerobaculia bacterium]|nr:amino acid adenylation domain-containing protein [Thermoanaerobaculia bacterium]
LPIQYADFAVWQRKRLHGPGFETDVAWWRERLAGVPGLTLPTDRPRPAVERFEGKQRATVWPAELSRDLTALARQERATLFMVLLAAFQGLLARSTGQTDVPVGSPVANRGRSEVEGLIGFFANTLVLRTDLAGRPTFRELLQRVREVTLAASAHDEIPFEKLVEEIQPERDMSRNPLFQVMLVLQNQPWPAFRIGDITLEPFDVNSGTAKFDLTLFWREQDGRLVGLIEHNTDLYDDATVARFVRHYEALLRAALADLDRPVAALPLLDEAEHHQILVEWNGAWTEFEEGRCIHRLVEDQVARTPRAVAVFHGGRSLTYAELNSRANRLAHGLRRLGVGPESLVGICVERGIEMVVAMLGVLKAGGAGVALDPAYPRERLAFIIREAGLRVLLTQTPLVGHFPEGCAVRLLLDPDVDLFPEESAENPDSGVSLDNPIYGIYTSGSTGQPKGILVTHRAFSNLLAWQLADPALVPEARTVQFATFGFCVSFQEMFSSWGSGGALVLADEMTRRDIPGLTRFLEETRVERLHLPFAALKNLAEATAGQDVLPARLQEVITAGEQLQVTPAVRSLFERLPGCTLSNQYGASETHVISALTLAGDPAAWMAIPPVGRPIANVRIYLLDEDLQPVSIGVAGELWAAGACVARCYLDDPVLTAQKMIPDPFSVVPGARMYRTGDAARYLADGRIEYHGRLDTQVKIRGFRVELGEIDTVLARHPAVRDTAVVARASSGDSKRLVAYVVPAGETVDFEELRSYLKKTLPEYMVPTAFVQMEKLPLNANGKLDQAALPEPEERSEAIYVAPRNAAEEMIAGIWAEVLRRERVSASADFFELGGHSLLATQVVSRVRSAFGVELALRTLFEAPRVSELAARVEALRATEEPAPPLRPAARTSLPPLSFAQERLWFLDQLQPGSAVYDMPGAVEIEGYLQPAALAVALAGVVARHESLRTTFETVGEEPRQRIAPALDIPLPLIDVSAVPEEARRVEAERLAREHARIAFDLARGPLLASALVRLDVKLYQFLVTMHHIVSDGWSVGLLVREVAALYAAAAEGRPAALPPLPVQYADFAVWQRGWLIGDVLARQLGWWRERLAVAPAVLDLPSDRPRPPVVSHRGASLTFAVEPALVRGLEALARREGATLYMTLLAGFQALLSRWSAQDDLVVGTAIAGRTRLETERLIGLFVNSLALRGDLSGDPDVRTLLARTREAALGAYAHQDVPLERLVEELRPERSLAHAPLFQVMCELLNTPSTELAAADLRLRPAGSGSGTAKLDLSLGFQPDDGPSGDGLAATLEYATDLFDAATMRRLAGHLCMLLAAAVADPGARVSALPLLTAPERLQILEEWNDSRVDFPPPALGAGAHALFEEQAARTPTAVAVVWGEETLTYEELERQSSRLARRLRRLGVGPEVPVGVHAERAPELVVAFLGVLKAGGVYVPLDPFYPAERLAWIVASSAVPLLLTQERLAGVLPPFAGRVVLLDDPTDGSDRSDRSDPSDSPAARVLPEQLAYVLYTSGSTGRPKGCMITHRGLVSFLRHRQHHWPLGPEDAFLQKASIGFDLSVAEILISLSTGARLVLPPPGSHREDDVLAEVIERHGVTTFHFVPSQIAVLLDQERFLAACRNLRFATLGGEALGSELAQRFLERTGVPLVNSYGPTEITIESTWRRVWPGEGRGVVPIGRPFDNLRIRLLDRAGRLVPAGVPGEVFIGGTQVGRGYLNRPDLTAERFVPDPFAAAPGERLYRTGDLASWRTDGELEFLGRLDHQIKLRGVRIELGEIESVLESHPEIRRAVVVARPERGEVRLAACLVAEDAPPDVAAVRAWLRERLPEAMVPAGWIVLPELPMSPNGKVDRAALLRMEPSAPHSAGAAPLSTPAEETVAAVWRDVLGLAEVGARDSFFDLGGHSLLATRVVSRLRQALGIELPVRALFEHPVLADLAAVVRESIGKDERAPTAPAIVPVADRGRLPLSFAQQRLWFLDQLAPGNPAYNIHAALRLSGRLDREALAASLGAIVARHEVLRTTFGAERDEPVQRIAPSSQPFGEPLPLPVVDLTGTPDPEEAVQSLALQAARQPFDLSRGPLLRATLLRLSPREHVLLFALHHIAGDGWSISVLVREVAALYAGEPLAPLPVQYADFAVWQRAWMQGAALEAELSWWRERLAGAPPALELPADHPRPAALSGRGASRRSLLTPALEEALGALGRRQGATLFMTLLAGFATVVARITGRDDLVIGTHVANRNRAETEGLIGFFVNELALRLDAADDPPFVELLARARETALGAYAHQDLPFERLVEELRPVRDLSRQPVFQISFALQNLPDAELRLPGLTLRQVPVDAGAAQLDLDLEATETPEGILLESRFSTDLFEPTTVDRLLGWLSTLLAAAVKRPGERISSLRLLTPKEEVQVSVLWNQTAIPYSPGPDPDRGAHGLIEWQAAQAPGDVALVFDGGTLTYGELDRRANRWAHRLRRLGVTLDTRVGVCAERSPELVVAALAILKAGGAYVPLDPEYPAERLAWLFESSQVPLLLIQEKHAGKLPPYEGRVVALERIDPADPIDPSGLDSPPSGRIFPESLAYVIHTSGSTGRPKGAMNTHRGLVNQMRWMQRVCPFDRNDLLLQKTPMGFDVSVAEIFNTLSMGARLAIAAPGGHRENDYLLEMIERHGVTILQLVPSHLFALLEQETFAASCRSLRRIIFGGEALTLELAQRASACLDAELWNTYGPAEAAVESAFHIAEPGETRSPLPLGRPLDNVRLYVLDRNGNLLPPGVPGDLHVGGVQVGRGYLNRPDLTADRYGPDPFGGEPGTRLYRSGDLTRLRPDGVVEFLGRLDHQVKVRGVRIELGEIEAVLESHPGVREAVVVARRDRPDEVRLVACVVPASEDLSVAGLRAWLRDRLPLAMIPSSFRMFEALPVNPNDKVDRAALARLELSSTETTGFVPPSGPVEEALAAVWSDVLGVPRVGARDNFFDLGGHSLMAARVVSRLRTALAIELPVRAIFENPVLADLAAAVEPSHSASVSIVPADRSRSLPLSWSQQRLWFLDQLQPGSAQWDIGAAWRLAGRLEVPALIAAARGVVRRHETLRTVFPAEGGWPVQTILPADDPRARIEIPSTDLSALPADRREAEALRLAMEHAALVFDLAAGPLLALGLIRLAAEEHILLFNVHHIVSDGWSQSIFQDELATLYTGEPLPELPVQYADYAVWQRGQVLDEQLAFWRRRLDGVREDLELPFDRPRPAVLSGRGEILPFALPPETAAALAALARKHGVSLFTVVLAGYEAFLARLTMQEGFALGTAVAGRNRLEIEGLIGFFVNTLVLCADVSGDPLFPALVRRVRDVVVEAQAHQDLPFDRLVEELHLERDLAHNPFFQAMLLFQNVPRGRRGLPGVELRPVEIHNRTAKVDLLLALAEEGGTLVGAFESSTDLFDRSTIERLAGHLRTLFAGLAADPEARVFDLPLLSAAEREQIVVDPNRRPNAVEGREQSPLWLHQLVERQAAGEPEVPAVVCGSESLSYGEVTVRAARLASHLQSLGVGPEVRVGLLLERSLDMAVAILGVLKAGGVFVPLDPAYPAERLAAILEDAQAALVVTHRGLASDRSVGSDGSVRFVLLEDLGDLEVLEVLDFANLAPALRDDGALAYSIFTSGSTGRPKGVQIPHRSAVHLAETAGRLLAHEGREVWTMFHSYAFDFSVWEMWVCFAHGGTLVLVPLETAQDPVAFHDLLAREKVTVLHQTPGALRQLVRVWEDGVRDPAALRLRRVACGGEAFPGPLAEQLAALLGPELEIWNLYGPTEVTVWGTMHPVGADDLRRGAIPLGRPIPDARVYVLDAALHPTPFGVNGEVCIGGFGVARGYASQPALTAERFVPDPFAGIPGARMYRTGDLGRRRPDGRLEFVGRIDFQVKVRGFRVELKEIEAALAGQPGVRQAVVLLRDQRLVAYLGAAEEVAAAELRARLGARLPSYMVPSAFVLLPELPLTPTGKLDRRALAKIEPAGAELAAGEVQAPRTPAEEIVAAAWSEVLGIERVGVHDNFFESGGHSLLATQVVSRLREAFGVEVPLRALFEAPTVAGLAQAVEELSRQGEGIAAPPLRRVPRGLENPLPLSYAQEWMWLLDQLDPTRSAFGVPLAVRLRGALDAGAFGRALQEVVRRHEALRTTFPVIGGRPVQRIVPELTVPLPLVDLTGHPEAEDRWIDEALHEPLDLTAGPLVRALLLRLGPEEHTLVLNLHHILFDGWSGGVILRELATLYRAFASGEASP